MRKASPGKKNGPARTPTKILALRGSWRAKERLETEPQAPLLPVSARAPAWLTAEGKKIWRQALQRLSPAGIVTELDTVALARYCQTLARWIKMEQFLQEHGEVSPVRTDQGRVTGQALLPQVGLYLRLSDQLCRMEQAFGLTPASRASLVRQQPAVSTPPHGNSRAAKDKARFFAPA